MLALLRCASNTEVFVHNLYMWPIIVAECAHFKFKFLAEVPNNRGFPASSSGDTTYQKINADLNILYRILCYLGLYKCGLFESIDIGI